VVPQTRGPRNWSFSPWGVSVIPETVGQYASTPNGPTPNLLIFLVDVNFLAIEIHGHH